MRDIKDSQNFLHNKSLVEKLVIDSNITKDDTVIEIGPGKGIITEVLDKSANKVIAIEFDNDLYNDLLKKNLINTSFINEDILSYTFSNQNIKIFSNIPFNMTTDIINKIMDNYEVISDFYLIMQKEAAYRFIGEPYTNESLKSLIIKPIYESKIVYEFNNNDFYPIPNIDIVLAHFHKKEYCDVKKAPITSYWDLVAYLYNMNGTTFKEKTKDIFTYEQQKRLKNMIKLEMDEPISNWTFENWIGIFNCYKLYVPDMKKNVVNGKYKKQLANQQKLDKIYRSRED